MSDAATRDLVTAANAAIARRDWRVAQAALESLLTAHPKHPTLERTLSGVLNNLARAELDSAPQHAEALWQRALQLWPDNPEALYNRAAAARTRGDLTLSAELLGRLVDLRPDDHEAALTLAEIECALDRPTAHMRVRALRESLHHGSVELQARWLDVACDSGDTSAASDGMSRFEASVAEQHAHRALQNALADAARAAFRTVARRAQFGQIAPGLRACIGSYLGLPETYRLATDMPMARASYEQGLAELIGNFDDRGLARCEPRLAQLQWTNFLLAYQGQNDLAPQTRYGDWLAHAARVFAPTLCSPFAPRKPGEPRVGLLSSAFRYCTVGAYFGSWPGALRASGNHTTVFQLGPTFDDTTARIGASADALVHLTGSLETMAEQVRAHDLDLLIFPDPAADARVMVLAALRLARRQAAAWGHPVTTGLPTIDFFFTCADMEPMDGAAHYREQRVLLPGLGTRYARPASLPSRTRADLGLPAGRLYLVPQSPYKIHPEGDTVLADIAARDPQGRLVLFEADRPNATRVLRERLSAVLRAAGAEPARQMLFLPQITRERFLHICRACDVMVDTVHWSGGNTAIDAILSDLPIVTYPGQFMRGRQSMAMLARLGLTDALVCDQPTQLAARAVAVASEPALRQNIVERMNAGRESLFNGDAALRALGDAVDSLIDPH